jgi:hypothetical protein
MAQVCGCEMNQSVFSITIVARCAEQLRITTAAESVTTAGVNVKFCEVRICEILYESFIRVPVEYCYCGNGTNR